MKNHKSVVIGVVIILLALSYALYIEHQLKNNGLITIAKVEGFEAAEQGVDLLIIVYFRGQKIQAKVDSWCQQCHGKFFYVKILKDNPGKYVSFFSDKPVPDCILSATLPYEGWETIPKDTCK